MKILKIFGIVVGIHVFALILIFANPGCSTTTKSTAAPSEPVARAEPAAAPITVPSMSAAPSSSSQPISFNPDAPAVAASSSTAGRHAPTRPGTPVAEALTIEPVRDVTPTATHVVTSGDSLWSIAKKHHITVPELTALNNLSANAKLRPGQKLIIPGKGGARTPAGSTASTPAPSAGKTGSAPAAESAAAAASTTAPRATGKEMKHVVKSGESLGIIARTYGIPAREIAVANNITDPAKIQAGRELIIPGWEPTASTSKSGKGTTKKTSEAKAPTTSPVEAQPAPAPATPAASTPAVPLIPIQDNPISGTKR